MFQSCIKTYSNEVMRKKQWQEQQKQQVEKDMEICRKLLREEKEERKQKKLQEQKEIKLVREEQRKQIEEEQRKPQKQKELSDKLDRVIRNSRNFNGMTPLECSVNIKDLPYIQAEDLFFLANNDRFKVSKNTISLKHLTPMQVPHRLFGTYCCKNCKKQWTSGYSWSNKWQQCKKCQAKVYPFHQRKLESKKEEEMEIIKPHDSFRCEKCNELGRLCVALRKIGI